MENRETIRIPTETLGAIEAAVGVAAIPHMLERSTGSRPLGPTGCALFRFQLEGSCSNKSREPDEIDALLERIQAVIEPMDAFAYKRISALGNAFMSVSNEIIVCPTADQYDVLEFEWGLTKNDGQELDYFVDGLKSIDAEFGIEISGAGYQAIEFVLGRVPTGVEAEKLKANLVGFCPDFTTLIYDSFDEEIDFEAVDLDDLIERYEFEDGRVVLWWD